MTSTLMQVQQYLSPTKKLTADNISELTGLDVTTVRKKLNILRADGIAVLEIADNGLRLWHAGYPATNTAYEAAQDRILAAFDPTGEKLVSEIVDATGLSVDVARFHLADLSTTGRLNIRLASDGADWYSLPSTTDPVADAGGNMVYVRHLNKRLKPQRPMLHTTSRPTATRTRCGLDTSAEYVRPATAEDVAGPKKVPPCPVCYKRLSKPVKGPGGSVAQQVYLPEPVGSDPVLQDA